MATMNKLMIKRSSSLCNIYIYTYNYFIFRQTLSDNPLLLLLLHLFIRHTHMYNSRIISPLFALISIHNVYSLLTISKLTNEKQKRLKKSFRSCIHILMSILLFRCFLFFHNLVSIDA